MPSKCWSFNPSERPKFSELVHQTKEMITVLEQQMKQGQHTTDIDSTYVNTETCTDYHYHDNNHAEEEDQSNFRNNRFISLYKVKSTSCINYL
jgi:hypothetical protein